MEERTVQLTLGEYTEQIARNINLANRERIINRIFNIIEDYAKAEELSSFSVKGIEISNVFEFTKELLQMLYYTDRSNYNRIVKIVNQRPTKSEGE